MGQKELKLLSQSQLSSPKSHINISRNIFDFQYIIGRGGFGKVWKVILKSTKTKFALKEMSKVKIIDRHSIESIINELKILSNLKNPFIINMHFAFQDYSNLYLVMDYLTGGDLRYHISKNNIFTEIQTKFFISNIIIGLEYIHKNNIIHRDIKPENLVLDNKGYVHITDFGIAKINELDNSSETSGTPGYMAPEVLFMQNHTFTCDFFALGVIGYEFCIGHRPYLGRSRQEIKNVILHKQVKINFSDIDKNDYNFINWNWSKDGIDFINKLIMRKPKERIGYYGIKELKEHKWMKNVNWDDILNMKIKAPFIPKGNDNFDKNYCEGNDKIGDETMERYRDYISDEMFTKIFKDYFYCRYDIGKFNCLKFDKKNYDSFSMKSLKNENKSEKKNNIRKKKIVIKDNFDEKTLRNNHSICVLSINRDKEKNNFKTTRNKIFDNCQLNEKIKSCSSITLNKSNSVQIISFNSKLKNNKKELKKPKKQYKSISSSNIHNLKIIYENNKNKMRVNKSLTLDNKKNNILNSSVKRNSSNFESESISKKIQNSPFSIKNKNIILKRPISKTDIHELFNSESFQLLNNLSNKDEKYAMSNRLNNKKNNQQLNSKIEIDKANSQRIGIEKEFVFQSKIMSWINQTNIITKSRSKDKILNDLISNKTENEKNSSTEKQDLNNNLLSPKVNLKNKNKSYNINYSNSRISKNTTKNSEGGNNKLSKNNFSNSNKYKCFSPISKKF